MCIFEIESIEHELEFAPKFFKLQKNTESRHTEKRLYQPKKKHYRHHPTNPANYLTPWGYFYNTNHTEIGNINCLHIGHPCKYMPMLVLTQCGLLVCLFVTLYTICLTKKPKTNKSDKNYTIAV